jgi:hypothetical protein
MFAKFRWPSKNWRISAPVPRLFLHLPPLTFASYRTTVG